MVHASKQIPRMKGKKHMPIKNRIRYDIHNLLTVPRKMIKNSHSFNFWKSIGMLLNRSSPKGKRKETENETKVKVSKHVN